MKVENPSAFLVQYFHRKRACTPQEVQEKLLTPSARQILFSLTIPFEFFCVCQSNDASFYIH